MSAPPNAMRLRLMGTFSPCSSYNAPAHESRSALCHWRAQKNGSRAVSRLFMLSRARSILPMFVRRGNVGLRSTAVRKISAAARNPVTHVGARCPRDVLVSIGYHAAQNHLRRAWRAKVSTNAHRFRGGRAIRARAAIHPGARSRAMVFSARDFSITKDQAAAVMPTPALGDSTT